jgi:hypothetical protein
MTGEQKVGGGRNDEFKKADEYKAFAVEAEDHDVYPTKIERSDIRSHLIGLGETEIVLQRHGAYIRDREDPQSGGLSEESAAAEKAAATDYFESFLNALPEEERQSVDVLFVASDTQYFDGGKRSYETATLAQEAAQENFAAHGIAEANIINTAGHLKGEGGPKPMKNLREPNFLNDSPDFLDHMLQKYGGIGLDFWVAFEEDKEQETRLAMGAEGPMDIADRTAFTLRVLARYAQAHHRANPDRRLVVWAATHYDTISPFVKRDVFGVGNEQQLLVDYGAGITIDIDSTGLGSTELGGKTYKVPLKKMPTDSPEN